MYDYHDDVGKATSNNYPNYSGSLFSRTCVTRPTLRFLHNLICLAVGNSTAFHFASTL